MSPRSSLAFALLAAGGLLSACASGAGDSPTPISCEPGVQECSGATAYRRCNEAGDGYDVVECTQDQVCVLGLCNGEDGTLNNVPGNNDQGGNNDAPGNNDQPDNNDTPNNDQPDNNDVPDNNDAVNNDADAGEDAAPDAAPDVPDEDAPADAPLEDAAPDVPEDAAPDVPEEDVAPDVPEEDATPDVPEEDTTPDAPADPCDPNPCTEANRGVCAVDDQDQAACSCDGGYVEVDGDCLLAESCEVDTCNGAGACVEDGGQVSCTCEEGYTGPRCGACDADDGFHRGEGGECTDDLCDPYPCGAPGACEADGVCEADTGDCSFAPLPACVELGGMWRWTFVSDPDVYDTQASFDVDAGGALSGWAIDRFGLAALTGTVDGRAETFAVAKDYVEGTSFGTFNYQGTVDSTSALSGTWAQEGSDTNFGTFTGAKQSAIAPADVDGAWVFEADFADIAVTLEVSARGLVTGSMSDRVGESDVFGVVDLGDGTIRLRKVYTEDGADWWYVGTVNAAGTSISGGVYSADSDEGQSGTWTGRR